MKAISGKFLIPVQVKKQNPLIIHREIGESIDNAIQDRPSIRDALTTSSSISNNTNLE
ncbi:hypothetical protein BH23THE1_BH23THE1_23180 [soil metagenome]